MLGVVNARFERFQSVVMSNPHSLASEYGTIVHTLIGNPMDHDAGVVNLAASICLIGPLNSMRTGEHSGQGRMEIDDAIWKGGKKVIGKKAHPAS